MPRPKSDDPKIPLSISLPESVYKKWEAAAAKRGRSVREHVIAKLVEAAENWQG